VKSLILEKEGKKRILERMTSLLFLKTKDEEALQGRVSEEFFSAVDALHSATARVSKLVRETNSSLGFELLEYYSNRKGLVSEKCYSYVRGTIDNLQDFELSGNELFLLQKAFSFLCEQPALFESCLLEMANVLRGKTLEYFVQSLTNYTLNIGPVQDPERYVNDMLAFIHHIFASQYEFLSSVLQGIPAKFTVANPETVEAADQDDINFSSQFLVSGELEKKILSVVSEGLCLPFQRRFEKALSPRLTVIVFFKLSSLLEFYSQLFENILGKDSPFVRNLLECSAQSMSYFFQIWKEKFDAALENMPLVDEELNPPLFVYQCTSRISEILDTLDMSLLSDEKKEGHAESILSVVIEQLLNFCFQSSQQLDNLNAKVFIINCLESIRVPLVKYKFAASKIESITREIDRYLDLYVEYVTKSSLEQSGLLEKLLRLQSFSSEEVTERIASIPGMDAESIAFVLKNFYMSILSEMEIEKLLNPPSSSKLASTRMRSRVKIAISESLISAYDTLFTLLNDPKNGYEEDATRKMGIVDTHYIRIALTS